MTLWVVTALVAAITSYIGCRTATGIAVRKGMITQPGARQSHKTATPTGGGLGIIFSILLTSLCLHLVTPMPVFWWLNMVPGIVLLAMIGWLDDKKPVSSVIRLLVQLAVSLWLIGLSWSEYSFGDFWVLAGILFTMVWMMNLYNFMDGSNGMAGFQGVFIGLVLAVLFQMNGEYTMALLGLLVASACAGFLPLNFPLARVFMGDVASVPLGFIFAAFFIYGIRSGSLSLSIAILIMSVFIIDATLTLLKRVLCGERWYTAHAQHVYQRLIARGWSHQRVLMVYQVINVLWVLPAIVLAKIYPTYAIETAGFVLILLGACWYVANWRLGMIATEQVK